MTQAVNQDSLKQEVGRAAAEQVADGMVLGLGTGSTAEAFLHALAERVKEGLTVRGVPTSQRTAMLCDQLNIPLTDLKTDPLLDLAIDGADEIDPQLNLIKGAGGALLREKIVAAAAKDMLVIADSSKLVDGLGGLFPLPIEINVFGAFSTVESIRSVCLEMGVRPNLSIRPNKATSQADSDPFLTDGGHWIVDGDFGLMPDPLALEAALRAIPGVIETGLFIGMASQALIAGDGEVKAITPRV